MLTFKMTNDDCFDLIFKDVLDNEDPDNFTDEFKTTIRNVIHKIREIKVEPLNIF